MKTREQQTSTEMYNKPELMHGTSSNEGKQPLLRRDRLAIILSILEITSQPTKKTHILYTAKINFYQLTRYLNLLLAIGAIEVTSDPSEGYITTEKGRILLKLFSKI
jgi:predicted transcriptional regulator